VLTSMPVSTISADLGFSSDSNMRRMFKVLTSMTPVEFRRRYSRQSWGNWQRRVNLPVHFPKTLLVQEHRLTEGATLRLECKSITVAPGGLTADGIQVRQLLRE